LRRRDNYDARDSRRKFTICTDEQKRFSRKLLNNRSYAFRIFSRPKRFQPKRVTIVRILYDHRSNVYTTATQVPNGVTGPRRCVFLFRKTLFGSGLKCFGPKRSFTPYSGEWRRLFASSQRFSGKSAGQSKKIVKTLARFMLIRC